jgi:hypothetical protein
MIIDRDTNELVEILNKPTLDLQEESSEEE